MNGLTKDEIKEIADRLDNCLGDNFHDLCVNAVGYTEISDNDVYEIKKELGEPNYIVHMAADTHVDNSISNPVPFVKNNIMSTIHMLEYARTLKTLEIFFYFSTDEVYGPALGNKLFQEDERHNPTNPYSASKAAAELVINTYKYSYNLPIIIIRCNNVYGLNQYPEKVIPNFILNALNNKDLNIHHSPTIYSYP